MASSTSCGLLRAACAFFTWAISISSRTLSNCFFVSLNFRTSLRIDTHVDMLHGKMRASQRAGKGLKTEKFGRENKGLTPSQNYATAALRISGPGQRGSAKDTKGKQLYLCRTEEY